MWSTDISIRCDRRLNGERVSIHPMDLGKEPAQQRDGDILFIAFELFE